MSTTPSLTHNLLQPQLNVETWLIGILDQDCSLSVTQSTAEIITYNLDELLSLLGYARLIDIETEIRTAIRTGNYEPTSSPTNKRIK
jgi:hypothetical protein